MDPHHLVIVPLRSRAPRGTTARLQFLTQQTLGCLVVSEDSIKHSCQLLDEADWAQARTHALGIAYADWRLRQAR